MGVERKIEVTSAAWIYKPEQLFQTVGQINQGRSREAQIGVELYPHHPPMGLPGPGRVTLDDIARWREFGNVPIERLHLPFHYGTSEASLYFANTVVRRWNKDWGGKAEAAAIFYITSTVRSWWATKMASELGAGLNVHGHVVQKAEKRGELAKMRGRARYLFVENDSDSTDEEGVLGARDPKKAIATVERNGLDGIIYGVDHDFEYGIDPRESFEEHKDNLAKHLRAIHISGASGDHSLIREDDRKFWDFIYYLRSSCFRNVTLCLDLHPLAMARAFKTSRGEVLYLEGIISKLES